MPPNPDLTVRETAFLAGVSEDARTAPLTPCRQTSLNG